MNRQTPGIAAPDLSPEMKLFLLCSVNEPSAPEREAIRALVGGTLDWHAFGRIAAKHRIDPIVWRNLKNGGDETLNAEMMAVLQKKTERNRMLAMLFASELIRLNKLFEARGVRMLCLKGPMLSLTLYGDISKRMSRDLDLLVCPSEVGLAEQALLDEGYRWAGLGAPLTDRQRPFVLKTLHHFTYTHPHKGVTVELHWQFHSQSDDSHFNALWASRAQASLNGKQVGIFNPVETLLYLVFHGSKHLWVRLKWLCDIQAILQKGDVDWACVSRKAGEIQIQHLLAQALILSNLFYHTELHEELFDAKTLRTARRLARMALPCILSDQDPAEHLPRAFNLYTKRYMFVWNAGIPRKLAAARAAFYPHEIDFAQAPLDDRHFTRYYFLRPVLVVKRKLNSLRKRGGRE